MFSLILLPSFSSLLSSLFVDCNIPIKFSLRVPEDGKFMQKEFDMVPQTGFVLPGAEQEVRVDFIPQAAKRYSCTLAVDIDGVGPELATIPITAECSCPTVSQHCVSACIERMRVGQEMGGGLCRVAA